MSIGEFHVTKINKYKHMKNSWYLVALMAGAVFPFQAGLNARLAKSIANPVYASMISFIVGAVALAFYAMVSKQQVSIEGLKSAPAYVWIAGALGAFYVTAVILAFPKIGPALTFGLVVAGQMSVSLFIDHFKLLGAQPNPVNTYKIIGLLLIVAGVVMIRKF
jgi:transporter family-2 protein